MALLFSAVTVTAGDEEIELIVGGIPRECDDLVGMTCRTLPQKSRLVRKSAGKHTRDARIIAVKPRGTRKFPPQDTIYL